MRIRLTENKGWSFDYGKAHIKKIDDAWMWTPVLLHKGKKEIFFAYHVKGYYYPTWFSPSNRIGEKGNLTTDVLHKITKEVNSLIKVAEISMVL